MRLNKDVYFMAIAMVAAMRGTCPRKKVGAVLVKNGLIVSTGYNGSAPGAEHCEDVGCMMFQGPDANRQHCIRTIHAEANAIAHAHDIADTLYTTSLPCVNCLKLAISYNPNITIIYSESYEDADRDEFLKRSPDLTIKLQQIEEFDYYTCNELFK